MVVGGQCHVLSSLPQENPGSHSAESWVGPRTDLDGCGKPRPHRDSMTGPSIPYRVTIPGAYRHVLDHKSPKQFSWNFVPNVPNLKLVFVPFEFLRGIPGW
jgi:hypothetical protein